jgi:hypothetical protein
MKLPLIIFSALLIALLNVGCSNNWDGITSFKLYKNVPLDVGKISNDSLSVKFTRVDINCTMAVPLLKKAGKKVFLFPVLWKGAQLAVITCEDGSKKKLLISNYGGFFKDLATNNYFIIPDEYREEWHELIGKSLKSWNNNKYEIK